jgi:mRNA interferase RelE/StbE
MYSIEWKESALKAIQKLDNSLTSRIFKKVEELKENLFNQDVKKLKGSELYRLRVGDYRVIFEIKGNLITILKIGHRQQIYER